MRAPRSRRAARKTRWTSVDAPRGEAYDRRFERLAASGFDVHGEAAFVESLVFGSASGSGSGSGSGSCSAARSASAADAFTSAADAAASPADAAASPADAATSPADAATSARATGCEGTWSAAALPGSAAASVLDAGCGTGRVAIELARRGVDVVGVDADASMLEAARGKAPALEWVRADLSTLSLVRRFDIVVMAGNVLLFVAPGTEATVVERLAAHLVPGGRLVAGFSLGGGVTVAGYDAMAAKAGLVLESRYATWERAPFVVESDYAVSVHRAIT